MLGKMHEQTLHHSQKTQRTNMLSINDSNFKVVDIILLMQLNFQLLMYVLGNHDLSFDTLHTNPFHFVGFESRLGHFLVRSVLTGVWFTHCQWHSRVRIWFCLWFGARGASECTANLFPCCLELLMFWGLGTGTLLLQWTKSHKRWVSTFNSPQSDVFVICLHV